MTIDRLSIRLDIDNSNIIYQGPMIGICFLFFLFTNISDFNWLNKKVKATTIHMNQNQTGFTFHKEFPNKTWIQKNTVHNQSSKEA